jgi:hypothetical protein
MESDASSQGSARETVRALKAQIAVLKEDGQSCDESLLGVTTELFKEIEESLKEAAELGNLIHNDRVSVTLNQAGSLTFDE